MLTRLSRRRHLISSLTAGALVAVCAISASAQEPVETLAPPKLVDARKTIVAPKALDSAKPFAAFSVALHSVRESLVAMARAQIGTRYVHGGESPERGFDCSGLVRYVMSELEVDLPRTAAQQARVGLAVAGRDTARLRPGDLLTFGKTGRDAISHIGIYVGNGRYVHASSTAGRVIESNIDRPASPLIKRWRGTRRVVSEAPGDSSRKGAG